MSIKVDMDIEGVEEMIETLKAISRSLSRQILKKALMKAGTPMVATAVRLLKAQVKNQTGTLLGRTQTGVFIGSVLSKNQRRGAKPGKDETTIYIGPYKARAAHLIEFGTGPRRIRGNSKHYKTSANRGALRPRPFMRPAWEQHKNQILESLGTEIWAQIKADAKKIERSKKRAAGARARAKAKG